MSTRLPAGFGTSTYFTDTGHGGVVSDADPEGARRGLNAMLGPELAQHYYDLADQPETEIRRIILVRPQHRKRNYFSEFLVAHRPTNVACVAPEGPLETEVWTWTLVDRDIPEDLKVRQRQSSVQTFGPSGIFEQDDAENWSQCTATMRGFVGRQLDLPFFAGQDFGGWARRLSRDHRCPPETGAGPKAPEDPSTGTGSP